MTDYSPAMLRAFERTVQAYEQAILDLEVNGVDPEVVANSWSGYGLYETCRLCGVVNPQLQMNCSSCILGPLYTGCNITGSHFEELMQSILELEPSTRLFKARLAWIIKKSKSNGVVLEEAK